MGTTYDGGLHQMVRIQRKFRRKLRDFSIIHAGSELIIMRNFGEMLLTPSCDRQTDTWMVTAYTVLG